MNIEELKKHLKGKCSERLLSQVIQSPFIGQGDEVSFCKWRKTFIGAFICKTPERIHLLRYIADAIGKDSIVWSDFTTTNLSLIKEHISESVSANSANVYLNIIKALLNENCDNSELPHVNFSKALSTKREPAQNIALSLEEIALIEAYKPANANEKAVKAQFLCEYYTMMRSSDLMLLTEGNFVDGRIVYVSKKTKIETSIPIHKDFLKYFRQMGKKYTRASYGRIIKRICKNVGITEPVKLYYRGKMQILPKYQLIQSHTARRSGATELAKRNVPISVISQLMNHDGRITTTERYIMSDTKNLCKEALDFFNGQ